MKKGYLALNAALLAILGYLCVVFFSHKPRPAEKALLNTPKKADAAAGSFLPERDAAATPPVLAMLADSDIFSPSRASVGSKALSAAGSRTPKGFELLGVVKAGSFSGAVVNIGGKHGFFRIGESIGDTGYRLVSVDSAGAAEVARGGKVVPLLINRNDKDSVKRRASASAAIALARKREGGPAVTPSGISKKSAAPPSGSKIRVVPLPSKQSLSKTSKKGSKKSSKKKSSKNKNSKKKSSQKKSNRKKKK